MNCEDAKIKCQMLIDDELEEEEIAPLMNHIESCYNCRNEYIELLKLRKKLTGIKGSAQNEEWFNALEKRPGRRFFNRIAIVLFIGSWLLLAAYTLFTFFKSPDENLFVKIVVTASAVSVIIIFITTIIDRLRESKTDKYKDVMK
ncbi:MAG: hypothetical protein PQJ46_17495 [Spirochaetales bacterium]|nr:hypothetical protein [Spirochaetales bacterium]